MILSHQKVKSKLKITSEPGIQFLIKLLIIENIIKEHH